MTSTKKREYTRKWNPSEEALDLANECVYHGNGEDIIFAGFRDDTTIWFIQGCSVDYNFFFGELDTADGTEMEQIAEKGFDVCPRYGFDGIFELGHEFED